MAKTNNYSDSSPFPYFDFAVSHRSEIGAHAPPLDRVTGDLTNTPAINPSAH
jgi:hypothetical protein